MNMFSYLSPSSICHGLVILCVTYVIIKTDSSDTAMSMVMLRICRQGDRKYKDYVYRKMLVQEYLKKWRIFKRVKPKNDDVSWHI